MRRLLTIILTFWAVMTATDLQGQALLRTHVETGDIEGTEEFKDSGKQFGETVLVDARTGKETVIFPSPKRE